MRVTKIIGGAAIILTMVGCSPPSYSEAATHAYVIVRERLRGGEHA